MWIETEFGHRQTSLNFQTKCPTLICMLQDTPFIFVRKETSLHVAIGNVYFGESLLGVPITKMSVQVDDTAADCNQTLHFHSEYPFVESIIFAVGLEMPKVNLRICLIKDGTNNTAAYAKLVVSMDSGLDKQRMTLQLFEPLTQFQDMELGLEGIANLVDFEEKPIGTVEIKLSIIDNDLTPLSEQMGEHPLSQHLGGRESNNNGDERCCIDNHEYSVTRIPQLHASEGIKTQDCGSWEVPSPEGLCWCSCCQPVSMCLCSCTE